MLAEVQLLELHHTMANNLIPPPELGHPLPGGLSHEQLVQLYCEPLDASEEMLIAGLRATLLPGADLRAAVKECYDRQSDEHFASLVRIAEHFSRIDEGHGRIGSP